jgi:2-polyprenyl-3-methyl-5-hydroxy-6-metoxy-1,4-benzoquinol methylase
MTKPFAEHQLIWDSKKVKRFWDFAANHPEYRRRYFSRLVGNSVISYLRQAGIRTDGRVLDFGCGPGYLMEQLISKGISCEGVDFSRQSVTEARDRLEDRAGFVDVSAISTLPSHLPALQFDVVFCLEMIEHLSEDTLHVTLKEFYRILAPAGVLVLTTPNEEDLLQGETLCAECGARFHRMQHVQSWSKDNLREKMEQGGFETIRCRPAYFTQPTAASILKAASYRLLGLKLPNLIYIGKRARSENS